MFVSSHYRNSANDLQILADSSCHEIFALLAPGLPSLVICAMQIVFEGLNNSQSYNKVGNAIPWILNETYNCDEIFKTLGARIIRIAVHPKLQSMGYGSKSIDQLKDYFMNGNLIDGKNIINKNSNILLNTKLITSLPKISWMGTCFGLNEKLLNFWKRKQFLPIGIKQTISQTTGEYSCCLLSSLNNNYASYMIKHRKSFHNRLLKLFGYSYKSFLPSLSLSLIHNYDQTQILIKNALPLIDEEDLTAMQSFVNGTTGFNNILHIMPAIANYYFSTDSKKHLSVLHQSILLMIGLQHNSLTEVGVIFGLEKFQLNAILTSRMDA